MNYEKFGICVTIAIVVCLCGLAAVASGNIDLDVSETTSLEEKRPWYKFW